MQHPRLIASLTTLFVALFCYFVSDTAIPVADEQADQYFTESIQAAGIAYAGTRGVNAVVSVVKESQLEVAPAGVGVSIAAGQILDPIDDMTERLSSVLVAAIGSLGVQKLGYEIGKALSFKIIALLLLLAIPLIWLRNQVSQSLLQLAVKLALILLLLRFMLPTSALLSDGLYSHWLAPEIESSMQKLSVVSDNVGEIRTITPEEDQGFFSGMTSGATDKVTKTREALQKLTDNAENIISSLLSLMTAYLAIFAVQVLLLPLAMLWLLASIYRSNLLNSFASQMTIKLTT